MKTIEKKEVLASQPTFSRLNQKLDQGTMQQLQMVNDTLQKRIDVIEPKENLMMDLDSIHFETYGKRQPSTRIIKPQAIIL